MHITFVGCGDAFGSGGRLNTCFHVRAARSTFLIDCGASSLIGMNRCGIDRNAIDTILVTHFHADHFGGIPFFMLDAQFNTKRMRPLTIAGPPGLRDWYARVMETSFAGSSKTQTKFELNLVELESAQRRSLGDITVRPARVRHAPSEGPFFAYRIEVDGRTLAFSGDTEWVENLVEIGREADLLISECYSFGKKVPFHLDYATLQANLPRIKAKRVILTHLNTEALAQIDATACEVAQDGMTVEV
ncbi:MAG: MBL fold metallo-hydrolase [Hyphomicrobiales bacterium]|nr:MBL fold metallo-hydrolase [Hyphomicrobiales bacterium]MBV8823833.1 MBL fold metallo-hydrolase [Hyphomicrobiales bacterium]MBV9429998.1 MBL fold metallo-hydrolase [Bradyrhizobiaceae bacterium]